jgi:thiamine biosynthesis lipoprotein
MRKAKGVYSIILVTLLAAGTVVLVVYMSKRGEGTGEPKNTYHSPTVFAMDTSLDITIQGRSKDQAKADVDAAVALAREIESHTSRFKQESDVYKINANAGVAPVKVNADTMYLVGKSVEYGAKTGGAFDITVAPLVGLWGFYDQKYRIPSQEEISGALPLVDYRKIAVDQAGGTVMLPVKGMQIDMGGVAKGYAVEQMYNLLKQRGVKSALINFGGCVGALGRRADGKQWVVGIKHPRVEGGELVGELQVENAFVNTSGDYERFFIKDGKRYYHILDPATGYQPRDAISATVVGPDAMAADILAKAPIVMGPKKGLALVQAEPGFEALAIDSSGNILYTPGMKQKYVVTMLPHI